MEHVWNGLLINICEIECILLDIQHDDFVAHALESFVSIRVYRHIDQISVGKKVQQDGICSQTPRTPEHPH